MGDLLEDTSKILLAGVVAEEIAKKHRKIRTCDECGKNFPAEQGATCMKKGGWWGVDCTKELCKDCAMKCRKCRKYFCSKHIDDHKCE